MQITKLLIFATMMLLLACGQSGDQGVGTNTQKDTTLSGERKKQLTKDERQRSTIEDKRIDSLRLGFALQHAFNIAEAAFGTNNFSKQYELQPDDSSYIINVEILVGKLFQDNQEYFLLRRHLPGATYLDLYKVNGNKVDKQIHREQGGMTYVRDTIFDANGDGHKDFVVHWYPSSGCCRRDIYNVYLRQSDKESFTKNYKFVNPTFSPKERIIRGVEYGHPGEVGLYKFRWVGLQVDTIEFIYPDVLVEGQFIRTKKAAYRPAKNEGVVLDAVPMEYHNIESYDWFAEF
jgi:hypothetical protein